MISIVYVIDDLGRGGAQRQLTELVKAMPRERYDVHVVSLSTVKVDYVEPLREAQISLELVPQSGKWDFPCFFRLVKILRMRRPQIVHTWLFTADLYGRLAAWILRVPVVISAVRSVELFKPSHYVAVDRFLARATHAFTVNARAVSHVLTRREGIPRDRIRTIYNGVDTHFFDPSQADGLVRRELKLDSLIPLVGIVGRLSPEKDHETFLRAAALVAWQIPQAHFLVLGRGALRGKIRRLSNELGLNGRLHFLENPSDVREVFAAVDLVVVSSVYEGCSNVILEAMAMGRPVVATQVGGNPELVTHGKTGFLVPSQDPARLAQAMVALMRHPTQAQELGRQGRLRVEEEFSLPQMVRQMSLLYEELLNKKINSGPPTGEGSPRFCVLCEKRSAKVFLPREVLPERVAVFKCRECSLVFLESRSVEGELDPEEDAYWDKEEQGKIYLDETVADAFVREFERRLLAMERFLPSRGRLLDVGCGVGHFLRVAKRLGWEAQGLDISDAASQTASEAFGLHVKVGTLEGIPFPEGSFDAVTLWDVIEHVRRPVENLIAANRLLKEGGILSMKTPNESSLFKFLARFLYRLLGKRGGFLLKYVYYVPHYFSYSEKTMSALLKRCGFELLAFEQDETPLAFSLPKINAHYGKDPKRSLVIALLPFASRLARLVRKSNKLVVYARKVHPMGETAR